MNKSTRTNLDCLFFLAASALILGMGCSPKPHFGEFAPPPPAPSSSEPAFKLETWPSGSYELKSPPGSKTPDSTGKILQAYVRVNPVGFAGWDEKGGMYVVMRFGDLPQLHRVAAPMAKPILRTFFPSRVSGFYPNPEPKRKNFLFLHDEGGDERFRLHLFDWKTGKIRDPACPPGRVTGVLWGDSGKSFVYSHIPDGTSRTGIYWASADGKNRMLFSRPGTWTPLDWSPDEAALLVQKYVSASESQLHLFSFADGGLVRLLSDEDRQSIDQALWMRAPGEKANRSLCFISDREGQFRRLYAYRLEGKPRALSPAASWDVEWAAASRDRKTVVYSMNEEGRSRLFAFDAGSDKPRALGGVPKGVIEGGQFRSDGKEFGFTMNSASFPGEAFSYNLGTQKLRRWTGGETEGLPSGSFREPELIQYPTFDSVPVPGSRKSAVRKISAWLYLPPRAAFGPPPYPVLVQIHGGPESQARPGFDAFVQYAVGRLGMAVILPNVRGSSGYGKSYLAADDGYLRMNSVRDVGALLDWIRTRPDLNAGRVAVAGRSYGGFMALSAMTHYGDRFRAGVSTVGIGDFLTFLKNTGDYRRDLRRAEYGDERDGRMAAFLDSISPLNALDKLKTPLLLAHGQNDPRVPYEESRTIFTTLKKERIPTWFLSFRDEGHVFRSPANQLLYYRTMGDFLTRNLDLRPTPR